MEEIVGISTPHTRLIINFFSRLWQIPLEIAQHLKLSKPLLPQNWLTPNDIENIMNLEDLEVIRYRTALVMPIRLPIITSVFNNFLGKIFPFNIFSLTHVIVARPIPSPGNQIEKPMVSVIIPVRNEAGNINAIFERTPNLGRDTELIFVEGHLEDNTYAMIEQSIQRSPDRRCQLHRQNGKGKGDAVRLGFEKASGEMLVILDGDLSVPPEDLPRFYNALVSGKGEFINGVRLIYPMEEKATRFLNLVGNKLFSLAFSWLMEQPIKDTLCGTKALFKADYDQIASRRSYFGGFGPFGPFGDFDLLFGAAGNNLEIVEVPIRYRKRTYGKTNIHRWRHGWLLVKMASVAVRKLKFGW